MRSRIKKIIKKFLYRMKYKRYQKQCREKGQREFFIFNTPIHGNLGDHAIIYAEEQMLISKNIEMFEIPTFDENLIFDFILKNTPNDSIVAITGGGFIGSQWMLEEDLVNKVLDKFSNHKIIIFPQTIFFKDDELGKKELQKSIDIIGKCKDINIFAREDKTYQFAQKTYPKANVKLVPDIVLSLDMELKDANRENFLICMRKDVEGIYSADDKIKIVETLKKYSSSIIQTDTVVDYHVSIKNRKKELYKKFEEFSNSKLVVTDRLHGMVFATLTNTPCIVLSNYNYKVKGVYEWIKKVDENIIFKENLDNIEEDIEKLLSRSSNGVKKQYVFDELLSIIGEN